jgi:methylmalonyl-CoA mutase N-terminal domain/subunit
MTHTALLAAPLLLSALAACSAQKPEAAAAETTATATATATAGEDITVEKRIVMKADGDKDELALDLSDGTGASIRLPAGVVKKMGEGSKVDIDGVGLYPGARVTSMAVASSEKAGTKTDKVDIAFAAPGTPAAVADWYVAAFREKGHTATRQGASVTAKTSEGANIAIDLAPEGKGSKGNIRILEAKKA